MVCKEHDPYVEAIVGTVFYDSNYDTTRRWISDNMLMDYRSILMDTNGDLLMKMSDNMALDLDSGDIHFLSSFGSDDDD